MKNLLLLLLLRRHFERPQLGNDIITKKIVSLSLGGCYNSHFPSTPSSSTSSSFFKVIIYLFMYLFGWLGWRYPPPLVPPIISPDQNLDHDSCALSPVFPSSCARRYFSFFSLRLHLESTPTGRERARE